MTAASAAGEAEQRPFRLRKRIAFAKRPGITAGEEAGDLQLARLSPQVVALLDFADQLELREGWVETVGRRVDRTARRVDERSKDTAARVKMPWYHSAAAP